MSGSTLLRGCKAGDKCAFSHVLELTDAEKKVAHKVALRIMERSVSRSKSKGKGNGKRPVCRQYKDTGSCTYGDNCRYEHARG